MRKKQSLWVEKYPSVKAIYDSVTSPRRLGSEKTVESYVIGVQKFVEWLGEDEPESVLGEIKDGGMQPLEKIDAWIDYMLESYAHKSVLSWLYGIKKWLEVNGAKVDLEKIDLPTGAEIQEVDRSPTRQHLITLMNHARTRERTVIEILAASGLRIGTLLSLTIGDVDFNYPDVARITVERASGRKFGSGNRQRARRLYVTWITPEAKEMLQEYLKERKLKGEELTPKSPLVSDAKKQGQPLTVDTYRGVWLRLLGKAGLNAKSQKWHVYHIHTLRKYFRSNCVGVDESYRENWMGHKGGYLDESYFRAEEDKHLAEYRKAIPYLSIYRHAEDESWKLVIRAIARTQGKIGEDKLRKLEEILARAKNMDDALEKFRLLQEDPNPGPKENNVKIVKGEQALVNHLKQGWTLIKELNHDRYLLRAR